MKYLIIIWTLGLLPTILNAQVSLNRQTISSSGTYTEVGLISLQHTIGEAVTETADVGNIYLTQGFQQPDKLSWNTGLGKPWVEIPMKLYPNPAYDQVWIEFPPATEQLDITVIDGLGREMLSKPISIATNAMQLNTVNMPQGIYVVKLSNKSGSIRARALLQVQK